jgi:cell division protein FtsN
MFFKNTIVFIICFIISILFVNCQKKQAVEKKQPSVSSESVAADTYDVFKEFYSEESSSKEKPSAKKKSVETFSTTSSSSSSEYNFSENGRYTIQVSCVASQSFANSLASKLKGMGFPAYVADVENPTPELTGTYYRVRIGGFNGLSEARSFAENNLVSNGYEYWIDNKSNDHVGMEGYGLGSGASGYGNSKAGYDHGSSFGTSTYSAPATSYTPEQTQVSEPVKTTTTTTQSQTQAEAKTEQSTQPVAKPSTTPATTTATTNTTTTTTTTPAKTTPEKTGKDSSGWESEGGW